MSPPLGSQGHGQVAGGLQGGLQRQPLARGILHHPLGHREGQHLALEGPPELQPRPVGVQDVAPAA
eukprot:1089916-Lingulodinium_polyedra.AAC.2